MQDPKVSIIIPVYNGSNFLKYAIDCALSQTYENIEIIVVNDGSTDGGETEKIALSYRDRIRYFRKPNGGVSSALNFGIEKMTGDYFSWLSHDDLYLPEKIRNSVDLLKSHDALGKKVIAYTGVRFIDAKGNKLRNFKEWFSIDRLYSGYEAAGIMAKKGTLFGCCMLIPKIMFQEVSLFHENLRYSQDALMWYQMFLSGYFIVSDNLPNVMCRIHSNQVSQQRKDLFMHDSYIIATLLANPLSSADGTGSLLKSYMKRLTRYPSRDAVHYLSDFAVEHGHLTKPERLVLSAYMVLGKLRYTAIGIMKRILFHNRMK